jgi:hypothetical protein
MAHADPSWLGSDEQLALLRESLDPVFGVSGASLVWGPSAAEGSWDPEIRQVTLPRPAPSADQPPDDVAELTALALLHQSLHARYSTAFRRYPRRRRALPATLHASTDRLFHVLEDARLIPLAVADDPSLEPALRKIVREGTAAFAAAARANDSGEGPSPKSQYIQLRFAIETYAVDPARELTLHPKVAGVLDQMKSTIDGTRWGNTEDCGGAAVKITRATVRSRLET